MCGCFAGAGFHTAVGLVDQERCISFRMKGCCFGVLVGFRPHRIGFRPKGVRGGVGFAPRLLSLLAQVCGIVAGGGAHRFGLVVQTPGIEHDLFCLCLCCVTLALRFLADHSRFSFSFPNHFRCDLIGVRPDVLSLFAVRCGFVLDASRLNPQSVDLSLNVGESRTGPLLCSHNVADSSLEFRRMLVELRRTG
jgi:hypothetical protein